MENPNTSGVHSMVFVGIDPGLSGAIAILRPNGSVASVSDTPVLKVGGRGEMDGRRCLLLLREAMRLASVGRCVAVIEWAMAMPPRTRPGQKPRSAGLSSTFNYGVGFGTWLGLLYGLQIPFQKARPQAWKKELLMGYSNPDKSVSIAVAGKLWPDAVIGKKDGRAEALLIAEFGRRLHGAFTGDGMWESRALPGGL